jgi:6-phosphogluconolactonase/glucosamine-6-phosphate isomerase/deaminase
MHLCNVNYSPIVRDYAFADVILLVLTIAVFAVDIPSSQVHILDGNSADLVAECQAYEKLIKSYNGVELFLGGIGEDGHIAFNEPGIGNCSEFLKPFLLSREGSSLSSRTRIKTLAYETVLANARFFGNDISKVPRMALTVGVGTILDSREVVIVATGQRKSLALSKAIGWLVPLTSHIRLQTVFLEEGVNHLVIILTVKI